jgi:hypothetical protein
MFLKDLQKDGNLWPWRWWSNRKSDEKRRRQTFDGVVTAADNRILQHAIFTTAGEQGSRGHLAHPLQHPIVKKIARFVGCLGTLVAFRAG